MELKGYQKTVIADLVLYLEIMNRVKNVPKTYDLYWQDKGLPVKTGLVPAYNDLIKGVPHVCFKVPTGGGKTFIACNAIKPVFNAMPFTKTKAVAWLVPSDTILKQTLKNLSDPSHPYRQKIDADFGGRVEVYAKNQLLNGQNFNPASVSEQLSIFILSFDSLRAKKKEDRKIYQENGNLAQFAKYCPKDAPLVENTDESALINVIAGLFPLVIVDESHHAQSDLSVDMLKNLNPCFVIDLTATPRENSNVISYVSAKQLKDCNMVKLPVIVYNCAKQNDVLANAIRLRDILEAKAQKTMAQTGEYIRPIVLFQAESRQKDDATTFEKLKAKLIEAGIPTEEIAIKTANVNELEGVELLGESCKIRYIITIDALKEGWDCPFAYILATLANRTSSIAVEQTLGRILRQPYVRRHEEKLLNKCYVFTSSEDFQETLKKIVAGLNNAGFSRRDYRAVEALKEKTVSDAALKQTTIFPPSHDEQPQEPPVQPAAQDESCDFDPQTVSERVKADSADGDDCDLIASAIAQSDEYDKQQQTNLDNAAETIPEEARDMIKGCPANEEFAEEIAATRLPVFMLKIPGSIFGPDETKIPLDDRHLSAGFTLRDKATDINFDALENDVWEIDVKDNKSDSVPKCMMLEQHDAAMFKELLARMPATGRINAYKGRVCDILNRIDNVPSAEIRRYVGRIVKQLEEDNDTDKIALLESSPEFFASRIKQRIESLLNDYCEKIFNTWLEQNKITCEPDYQLPKEIAPVARVASCAKSLYEEEEAMNDFEFDVKNKLEALPNIRWWHRNIARKEFSLNGWLRHYPDFIAKTESGVILLIETKGDHLENEESRQKLELGRKWQEKAGSDKFKYYMVFKEKDLNVPGAYPLDEFLNVVRGI